MSPATQQRARDPRTRQRRSLHERQTLIIGGLVTVLVIIALVNAGIWAGLLPSPINREFSSEPEPSTPGEVIPCPPEGGTPVEFSEVTANVYNGTDRAGLAGATAETLAAAGVHINTEANWSLGAYDGAVMVMTGTSGVPAAYTLAELFPNAVVGLDERIDESVDVVLGDQFETMLTADEIAALDRNQPFAAPEGCQPIEE